jgi:putative N6-adenine-specific DNA methylase
LNTFELIVPCHFGLEAVMKKEILDLGYEVSQVEDGRVTFIGDAEAICRANIFLRTTERVLLKVGSFHAETFEDLFQGTRAIPWEEYLPKDAKFWVAKASSIKSKLFSPSDIQSIMKKAMVERMKKAYGIEWFPENGASFPLRVFLHKDTVTVALDTTGESLHKRGYRTLTSKAPITETLAAALIMLTPWKSDRILVDPFCGSGTFPIEAAMIAANMAPGMNREFLSEDWKHLIPRKCWYDAMDEANDLVDLSVQTDIQGYDIDGDIVRAARANAKAAGVDELIHFQQRSVSDLSHPKKYGFLITNPPCGACSVLLDGKLINSCCVAMGAVEGSTVVTLEDYRETERFAALDSWSAYIITAYEDTERYFGRKADKNRKIYNGMMKTYFYQFLGPKPPRKREDRREER